MRKHNCNLHYNTDVDILDQVIEDGIFINQRKKLQRLCMVSANHPMASVYYKSLTARITEDIRHITNYRWMIHPYSMLTLYWEMFIFIVYSAQFFTLAIAASANVYFRKPSYIVIQKLTLDYILTLDIVKQFFTGYYETRDGKTVMNFTQIAKRYLSTYFLLDLICCTHSYLVPFRIIFTNYEDFIEKTWILAITLKVIASFRILRMRRWLEALELFRMYVNLSSVLNRAFRAILIFSILLIWLYSMIFQIEKLVEFNFIPPESRDWNAPTFKLFYSATLMLLHVSYGDKILSHPIKSIVSLLFMAVGYCLQLSMYTQVMQVWVKFSNAKNKNENLYQQFTEYLNYKELPMNLRRKFSSFYQFKFQNQFYNEAHINKMTSNILRQEILVYVTKNHVQRVEFFQNLPDVVLSKIVSRLKSEIYLANDVIIKAGLAGTCMFFIYFGTVAIYTPSGREICHLEDGAHFGEIALIFNEPRVATVVAVTPCELFVLNRFDFLQVLEPFPEQKAKITKLAEERLRSTVFQK
ncbi:unnamed protein product [Phaedon cochleariae]|uniref:Cyclic nucleotide-binding domain-containing protein n=1 Tax=Phaedon cochleariae TaxID=80249 RepID=A0A9P0DST9_PHACE|nr:unnamed protein product [Phaedon cochleariae]